MPGLDQHRAAIKRIVDIGNQEFAEDIPKIQQAIEKMKADLPSKPVESQLNEDDGAH